MSENNSKGIEMLPLPEADDSVENHAHWPIVIDSDVWLQKSVQDYARAVAEHNVAARDAENEALRAEVERLTRANGALTRLWESAGAEQNKAEARAERLQAELDNRWATGVHTCQPDKCQRVACVLRRDNKRLAEAGCRVTAAFRALGEATAWTRAAEQARHECEAAMLALDAALRDHDQEPTHD